MTFTSENLTILLQLITMGGIVFAIFKFFRDPDIKNKEDVELIKLRCKLTHVSLDKDIGNILKNLEDIRVNHLAHIEPDIVKIKENIVKILTILKEEKR